MNCELLGSEAELREAARIIRESFKTVADEFCLNEMNCPSHPAFFSDESIIAATSSGTCFYSLYHERNMAGVLALKYLNKNEYSMEKLAVLPEYRHLGYGKKLVEFALDTAREAGAEKMIIGIIDENIALKEWYLALGFTVTDIKRYDHLPFTVCTMQKIL